MEEGVRAGVGTDVGASAGASGEKEREGVGGGREGGREGEREGEGERKQRGRNARPPACSRGLSTRKKVCDTKKTRFCGQYLKRKYAVVVAVARARDGGGKRVAVGSA